MPNVASELITFIDELPISKWGISKVSGDFAGQYSHAISLLQAYEFDINNYSPSGYHRFLTNRVKPVMDSSIQKIEQYLASHSIPYYSISNRRKDPVMLLGEYSQKRAAMQAGLGWIGKNSLLVTSEFGPRVRLGTILVGISLPEKSPAPLQGCGNCSICVQCCPEQCITGVNWKPGMQRASLIDITHCRDSAEELKNCTCGLCLLTCPVGREGLQPPETNIPD